MGIIIALLVIGFWLGHLFYILFYYSINLSSPLAYLHLLLQIYFYTGLFITAHDAMHLNITRINRVNKIIGVISSFLYAGMSYNRLIKNHFMHHKYPGTKDDPDFYTKSQNYFIWWVSFMIRYTTVVQLIIMAILFNLLKLGSPEINIWFFWVVPAILSSNQLFFFGTYLPHRKPHDYDMEPHKARTQTKNHLWAMLSCYFFGYHYEHHERPNTPWWQLYKLK
jgi:beta-carotene/zeaxanthin 4-ketolase